MTLREAAEKMAPVFDGQIVKVEVVEVCYLAVSADDEAWSAYLHVKPRDRRRAPVEMGESGETRGEALANLVEQAPMWARVHCIERKDQP